MKKKVIFMSLNAFKKVVNSNSIKIVHHEDRDTLFCIDETNELTYRCQQTIDPAQDMAWLIPIEEYNGDRKEALANACLVNVNRSNGESRLSTVGKV